MAPERPWQRMKRNTWIELDLSVFRENLRAIRAGLGGRSELILVVKADAYGHGLRAIAPCAFEEGVRQFVVSGMDEATTLRALLPEAGILVLGPVWPSDVAEIAAKSIVPVIISEEQGLALAEAAQRHGARMACHVKIDTGMGRLGIGWEEAPRAMERLARQKSLHVVGVCTHFASAGKPGDEFAAEQVRRFQFVVAACRNNGLDGLFCHVSNSAAFGLRPDWDMNGVRTGILAYGYGGRRHAGRAATKPFLQWKTRVVQTRRVPAGFPVSYLSTHVTPAPTTLATLDVGYSDGFSRLMSNRGAVLINGKRAAVVGRVTMNFTVVDVGAENPVQPGQEATLMGRQGSEELWADELARWCRTIPYEILTGIRAECRVAMPSGAT